MKKILTIVLFCAAGSFASAQTYTHPTVGLQSTYAGACMVNTSSGVYYDNGGAGGNYAANINAIYRTFCPTAAYTAIQVTFTSFSMNDTYFLCTGPGSCCDYLQILNGPTQNSTALYNNCTTSPGTVTSTDPSGCLTFRFVSDGSVQLAGWAANITSVPFAGGPTGLENTDCVNASVICSSGSSFSGASTGPGLQSDACTGCVVSENFTNWYKFTVATSGTLGFTINPTSGTPDYDFALYQASTCAGLGTPQRCSYAATTGATGLNNVAVDNSEDVSGDGWCAMINVTAGQQYYLLVNQWNPSTPGFTINWSGTATIAPPTNSFSINAVSYAPNSTYNVCQNNPLTINGVGFGGTMRWYNAPSGGTLLQTGSSYSPSTATVGTYNYYLEETTPDGCVTSRSLITVNVRPRPTGTTVPSNVSCFGGTNGAVNLTVSGGTGPYTYVWSPGGGTVEDPTNMAANTYTVTFTDAYGCTNTQTALITQPATGVSSSISASGNVSCFGGNNGTATVSASGGTPGYTYVWAPSGGTGTTASGLTAGTYTVTVTDLNGCTRTSTATITQPTQVTANISSSSNISCFGGTNGSATVSPGGGIPGYTYVWSPSGGTGATASGLGAGTYTVQVTDNNSCTRTTTVTITQPTQVTATISSSTNVTCFGGSNGTAAVTAGGGVPGYTYIWSPSGGSSSSASGLSSGTYTVQVTDNNGCTRTTTVNITQPATGVTSSISSSTNITCFGGTNGSATVSPNGGTPGYTYNWAPSGGSGATATGLGAGTYTVTVTDNSSCTTTSTVTLTQPTQVTANISGSSNVLCFGQANGSATVNAGGGAGGYTYVWSPSGGTGASASGLGQGTYTVQVTDASGCTQTTTVNITQPAALTAGMSNVNVTCNGGTNGTVGVTAGGGVGGYTYIWSPSGGSGSSASNVGAGTYTVQVTDANGCTITNTATVTEPSVISLTTSSTSATCGNSDGSATVNSSGGVPGYTYSWAPSGGSGATASNITAGSYTVTVTDNNLCTATATVVVNNAGAPVLSVSSQSDVLCFGQSNGSATINVSGGSPGFTYSWAPSGGSGASASNLGAGTYTVTVTDANNCVSVITVDIAQPTALNVVMNNPVNSTCGLPNGSASVTTSGGTPGYTYNWTPSGGSGATATNLNAGSYTVTVTDLNGCSTTAVTTLTTTAAPNVSITTSTDVTCNGGSNGTALAFANGGTPGYSYAWTPAGGSSANASNLSAGTYTVTVTDGASCTGTATVTINQPSVLVISITDTTLASCNQNDGAFTTSTTGGTPGYTYLWSNSDTTANLNNAGQGTYSVVVTDSKGCTASASAYLDCIADDYIIPQFISPNNDGKNDTWDLSELLLTYPNAGVKIFNRWGTEIFAESPYMNQWGGHSNNVMSIGTDVVPAGTYFFVIDLNGNGTEMKTGYIEVQP